MSQVTEETKGGCEPAALHKLILFLAAGFAALSVVCSTVIGVVNHDVTLFKWSVVAAAGVFSSAMGAIGYSAGKLFEGAIPNGMKSAMPTVGPVGILEQSVAPLRSDESPRRLDPDPRSSRAFNGIADRNSAEAARAGESAPRSLSGGNLPLLALLLLPILSLTGGCAGTSKLFQTQAPAGVNAITEDMREYTAAADWDIDHNGTVDAAELAAQAEEIRLTDALAASVKVQNDITVEGVESAWQPVEPRWRRYVATDPILETPEDKRIRNDTGDSLNRLIQVEKDRQAAFRSSLGLSALGGK
jgi:hypothetical protein